MSHPCSTNLDYMTVQKILNHFSVIKHDLNAVCVLYLPDYIIKDKIFFKNLIEIFCILELPMSMSQFKKKISLLKIKMSSQQIIESQF